MNNMKLSLSVITGNCEKDVERFLDVFEPHFDEIVMVRAIGSQKPDRTIDIAKARGCKVGEYYNKLIRGTWDHVDDFSEARNASARLCTGDWIMWADMDDTAEGLEHLRAIISKIPDGTDIIRCPYVVSDQGVVANYRERVWRNNGKHGWKNALHENLVPLSGDELPQAQTDRFRMIHVPRHDRDCSKERNLRILEGIPEADRTHAHTFYLMTEYARRKDAKAVQLAQAFLAHPEGGPAERFETFMTLAGMAEDFGQKAQIYTQAFSENPSRSEPLYELSALSLSCDEPERAMAYARHMMTCQWPENPCWNHRKMFYGYFRTDLYWQAMRACGDVIQSDTERHNAMVDSGMPIISLLHATRGRAMQAIRCRSEWLRLADHPERVDHIFALDFDDEYAEVFTRFPSIYMNKANGGPVAAWNGAAEVCKGEVMVQLSDDWKPFKGWDTAIVSAMGDITQPSVLAVSDGHRTDDLLCMAILTKARYKQQGYLFHPEFFSMFSDNWFSHCAYRDGVVIDARKSITLEHIHPAFGKAEMDETYARSNDEYHYKTGAGIFRRLMDGVTVSADMHGWFDFRDVYDYVAKTLPPWGKFAEVGCWKGKSICYLRDRLDDTQKDKVWAYAVDTFGGDADTGQENVLESFQENVSGRFIKTIQCDSVTGAGAFNDKELDGVFIDAAHDYESVKADIKAWKPKLKPGGFFGGHDADSPEVQKALNDCGISYSVVGRCWIETKNNP